MVQNSIEKSSLPLYTNLQDPCLEAATNMSLLDILEIVWRQSWATLHRDHIPITDQEWAPIGKVSHVFS